MSCLRTPEAQYTTWLDSIDCNGAYLHVALSTNAGWVVGEHFKYGGVAFPTIEVMMGEDTAHSYTREFDPDTGFDELVVTPS